MKGFRKGDPRAKRAGQKGGEASGRVAKARMCEAFECFPTKAAAGCHGYRIGYNRAYGYWKQWAERAMRKSREAA